MAARYHPVLVALHWLLAVLIPGALALGFYVHEGVAPADPARIALLRWHMAGGVTIFVLMLARLVVRMRSARPAPAVTGHRWMDRLAPVTHAGFYVLVPGMAATGYATGLIAGLPAIVFGASGDPLPPDFMVFPTFVAHGTIAWLLILAIGLHVAAALYHQFVRRDGLLSRMAWGARKTR